MKYLITGGAGFIGSNLTAELLNRGHQVRILDNFSTGSRDNLKEFEGRIEVLEGDLRNYHNVCAAVDGMDFVLHQGALPSVPRSIGDPISSNEANVSGTLNLLNAAKEAKIKRLVFASSSSIYGDSPTLPKQEDMPMNPLSPYAVSKMAGERYCQVFAQIYGLHTVALRYFNIFGPRQNPNSQYSAVIPKFIMAILQDRSPMIYGDGEQSRDFTYVANAVEANIRATEVDCPPGIVMNCAVHDRTDLNTLVEKINGILGKNVAPAYAEARAGDIKHSFADIERLKMNLKFEPPVGFDEGLRRTVAWYQKQFEKEQNLVSS
ncbi:MAG TPA: SDR family oxidoreductase [Calditrichia bacterium]|nr:SDR family oxidoreductase [Calditrichota bacterium]HQU74020.1 SDR family oxidoreductase [Calditrichia bacterium]HQV30509.1 SDR family oxidoreductase [Calditrichia bacterium]